MGILWHVNEARPLTVNATWVQDFCGSYWGRGALSAGVAELVGGNLGLPATMCHHKGPWTGWRQKRKWNPGDTAGGAGSGRPKADPVLTTFEKVIRY